MQITFNSGISFKDYYKFILGSFVKNPWIIYIFCATVIPGTYHLISSGQFRLEGYGIYYIIFFLYFLSIPLIIYFTAKRTYNSTFYLNEIHTYDINEDMISLRSESMSNTIRWSGIYKISESFDFLILYTSDRTALFISKKDVPGRGDIEQIKEWAKKYVKKEDGIKRLFRTKLFYFTLGAILLTVLLFSYERTLSVPALRGAMFYEALPAGVLLAFGFIIVGAILAVIIALIPRKGISYQARFFQSFIWVCLIIFIIMNLFLIIGIQVWER